jgi:long-chain-acyl-CoA dehydrogenase
MLRRVGELGFLGFSVPEAFGGAGIEDFRFNAVINEEAARRGLAAFALAVTMQNDVALPYFTELCNDEQRARWLPGIVSGELILGIAMSEPGAGSDLQGIQTRAVRDGDHYRVNGAKTFITNGLNAELIITAVRTGTSGGPSDISLVIVEAGTPGCDHRRQDRSEPAPCRNLVAGPGAGHGRLRARAQSGEGRPARAGHRGAVLHGRACSSREPGRRRG